MDDQHQHQHVTFPYILDGTGIDMSLDKNSHGQHDQSQSQAQSHGQNQVQMSPTDSTGATHSSSETLMYHPYAHPHHGPFTSSLHHDSSTPQLSQAHTLTLDPAQLRTSSIGPSRVLTRRQARMAAHAFTDTPRNGQQQQQQQFGEAFGMYGGSDNSPRPQTPNGFHSGPQLGDARIDLADLNMCQLTIPNSSAMSPQHPSTPASVTSSSNFSHYGFAPYAPHGHSRSASSSTHPRSASPASVVSTLSSSSDLKSGRARPPVSTSSTGCISVASFTPTPIDTVSVKPKRRLQNRQRKEICQYYMQHPNARQEDIAARWSVERSTISKILKNKHRWMAVTDGDEQTVAKHRPPKFGPIEDTMQTWLIECRDSGTPISDAMIRTKARECARRLNVPDDKFKASAGWVENYKHRAGIKKGIWVGKPDPGTHEDDETDEDRGPFIHELAEERRRVEALRAANGQPARDKVQHVMEVPRMDLGSSSMTLDDTGSWTPALGLPFVDSGSADTTDLENQMCGLNNGMGGQQDGQGQLNDQASLPFGNEGSLLQHHFDVAHASWAPNGGTATSGVADGTPSVSAQEASSAMQTVMRFLKTQRPNFLSPQERNILTDVKHLILLTTGQAVSTSAAASAMPAATSGGTSLSMSNGIIGNDNGVAGSISTGRGLPVTQSVSVPAA